MLVSLMTNEILIDRFCPGKLNDGISALMKMIVMRGGLLASVFSSVYLLKQTLFKFYTECNT